MSKLNSDIYINSETSKIVLNSIIEGKKINFKKLKIELLKKGVNNLKKQYLDIKNNNHYDNKDFGYRYFLLSAIKLSGIYIGFSERDYGISPIQEALRAPVQGKAALAKAIRWA